MCDQINMLLKKQAKSPVTINALKYTNNGNIVLFCRPPRKAEDLIPSTPKIANLFTSGKCEAKGELNIERFKIQIGGIHPRDSLGNNLSPTKITKDLTESNEWFNPMMLADDLCWMSNSKALKFKCTASVMLALKDK
ncbi:hypothetical protein FRB94_011687, partial [Tulasnella sp. JGI-2019a]